ncbi:MAG TPA: disulfide oxidoreductase [Chloroflexaceae bacterium]|nr:disulfide oxidoreductase [Chloroflexaceae bacterium]
MADLLAHHEAGAPAVDDETLLPSAFSTAVAWGSRYIALLAACLATGGSLFFSEALGWVPCTLCWYQRILMYPLSLLLAVGLLRRDAGLPLLVLPLSVSGAGVSLYHYLLIKTDWFPPPPCRAGVPCTVDYIDLFGFINIPFLALTAFLIITLMMVAAWLAPTSTSSTAANGWRALLAPAALPVYGIIAAVVGAYSLAAYLL